jgi:hypothetical protein
MSANCDEQVVRIRQRVVFSAIVGSDIPSGGVEAFGCRFEPSVRFGQVRPGRHLGKLSDGSYDAGSSTDHLVELGK